MKTLLINLLGGISHNQAKDMLLHFKEMGSGITVVKGFGVNLIDKTIK